MPKKARRGHKAKPKSKDNRKPQEDETVVSDKRSSRKGTSKAQLSTTKRGRGTRKKRGGDSGGLLTDPHRLRSDIQLVEMATKKGWNVTRKGMVRRRLEGIVEKTEAEVVTKEGIVSLESAADKLAIDAARVLVAMDGQDVTRVQKGKVETPPNPVQVNVYNNSTTVNFNQRTIELARLAKSLGASELDVEGQSVPVAEILRSAGEVQEG